VPVFKSEEMLDDLQNMFSAFYVGDYKYTSKKSKVRIGFQEIINFFSRECEIPNFRQISGESPDVFCTHLLFPGYFRD
jgi:hypothetical protein